MKIDVYVAASGLNADGVTDLATVEAGTRLMVGFGSASNNNISKDFKDEISIVSPDSLYVVFANLDNQAQDVYATVSGWS